MQLTGSKGYTVDRERISLVLVMLVALAKKLRERARNRVHVHRHTIIRSEGNVGRTESAACIAKKNKFSTMIREVLQTRALPR